MMMPGNKLDDEMLKQAAEEYSKNSGQAAGSARNVLQSNLTMDIRRLPIMNPEGMSRLLLIYAGLQIFLTSALTTS